jgi:uncharacterized membrane protein
LSRLDVKLSKFLNINQILEEQMTQQPMDSNITSDDKLWAALGYPISLIALIMLFVEGKKDRPFIKFHAVQSLAINVVAWVIATILSIVTLGIGAVCIPAVFLVLIWPAVLAYQGKYFEIPVVTKFIRDQHWVS